MSGNRPRIYVRPVTRATALKTCKRWHYSGTLPASKSAFIGCWEGDTYVGVVIVSWGANMNMAKPYGMSLGDVAELARVALSGHQVWETSKIVTFACREFIKCNPSVRMLVSYADSSEGHHGGIYKAMGWTYTGASLTEVWRLNGKKIHRRGYTGKVFGGARTPIPDGIEIEKGVPKHRYCLPLDDGARDVLSRMKQPAPKAGLTGDQPDSGGATPTSGL